MNVDIVNDKQFNVKVNSSYLKIKDETLYDDLKKILIYMRKKYAYDIYGFYNVDIYFVDNILTLLKFVKKDSDSYFGKSIDLKIIKHDNKPTLIFDDFLLLNNYKYSICNNKIKFNDTVKKEDVYKLCEHYYIENLNLQ